MTPRRSFRAEKVPMPRGFAGFVFPREGRVAIEIGAGAGWHAIQYARAHPAARLFAIEHTHERFAKLARRHARHPELSNLIPVHANAIGWITHFVPEASVDEIWLLYPNPYPKEKHRNRRWHADPFFDRLVAVLKPEGVFTLATNERFYADEAESTLGARGDLALVERIAIARATHPTFAPRTHFEKKYLDAGQTVYQLRWARLIQRAAASTSGSTES